mmetsp:Transcript_112993/g.326485  ORF Transcript_112993/g.326485 Transcript_112993/m.326485 type:complete len:247 (-) Transcript_112993:103-843(-)
MPSSGDGLLSTGIGDHVEEHEPWPSRRGVADFSEALGVGRPAAVTWSTKRCCIAVAACGVIGGDAAWPPLNAAGLRPRTGLGSKQNSRAMSSSPSCKSMAQIASGGLIHGTPMPCRSSSGGVIRAACGISEMDRRFDSRRLAAPSTEAGLQPSEEQRPPEGIMSVMETSPPETSRERMPSACGVLGDNAELLSMDSAKDSSSMQPVGRDVLSEPSPTGRFPIGQAGHALGKAKAASPPVVLKRSPP